ncbi:hypothetical protein ACWDRX_05075 [Streptomyces nigra]
MFYRAPNLEKSSDRIPAKLTYSTPVIRYAVQELPSGTNGMPVGFAYVQTQNGSVIAVQALTRDCLGIVERGPRGWLRRLQLERQARKRAKQEQNELMMNERVAALAAEIKEN